MNKAETIARKKIIIVFFQLTGIGFGISLLIFLVGMLTHRIDDAKHIYLITRIIIPTAINVIASFVALYVNASEKFDNSMKCFVCSFAFATCSVPRAMS